MKWVFQNLLDGLKRYALWSRLAMTDIQQIYRRSLFGVAWVALSFGMFITVKIFIFGSFAAIDGRSFAIWLAVGFWVWTFLTSAMMDGCNTFITARPWIIGTNIPLSVYVFQNTTKDCIRFMFAAPVVIAVILFYQWHFEVKWLWTLLGIIALVVNCLWVQLLLGSICAKYRDVSHLVQAVMHVMFFVTPILYTPEQLGDKAYLLNYNPFTHYLAIVRDPIYYYQVPVLSWQVVCAFTIIGSILALLTFRKMGPTIPFRV